MLKILSILFSSVFILYSFENKDVNFPTSNATNIISTLKKDNSLNLIQKWNVKRRGESFTFYNRDYSLVYNNINQNHQQIYIRNPYYFTKEFPLVFEEKFDSLTKYYIVKKLNSYLFVKHSLSYDSILKDTMKLEKVFKEKNPFEDLEYLSNFCHTNKIWSANNSFKQSTTTFDLAENFSLIHANNFQELSHVFDDGYFMEIEKNWYLCQNEK